MSDKTLHVSNLERIKSFYDVTVLFIDLKVCHPRCVVKLTLGRVIPSITQLEVF